MTAKGLIDLYSDLLAEGVWIWVDGGWAYAPSWDGRRQLIRIVRYLYEDAANYLPRKLEQVADLLQLARLLYTDATAYLLQKWAKVSPLL